MHDDATSTVRRTFLLLGARVLELWPNSTSSCFAREEEGEGECVLEWQSHSNRLEEELEKGVAINPQKVHPPSFLSSVLLLLLCVLCLPGNNNPIRCTRTLQLTSSGKAKRLKYSLTLWFC